MASNIIAALGKIPHRGWSGISLILAFATTATLTFGIQFARYSFAMDERQFVAGVAPDLSLRAQDQGDQIFLAWNRDNPALRSSPGGLLRVDDGPQHLNYQIDSALFATGSILYRPQSDDVSFHMEIRNPQGGVIRSSIRILDGARASHPAAAPVLKPFPAAPKPRHSQQTVAPSPSDDGAYQPELLKAPPPSESSLLHTAQVTLPSLPTALTPTQEQGSPASTQQLAPAPYHETAHVPSDTPRTATIMSKRVENNSTPILVPAKPIRQIMPDLRKFGARTPFYRALRVEVAVKLNESGNVTNAQLVSRTDTPGYVGMAALDAAKRWIFEPATLRGRPVASDYTVEFKFGSDDR